LNAQYRGELAYAPGKHHYSTTSSLEALLAADRLEDYSGIQSVQPQIAHWRDFTAIPNDPLYPDQWHLKNTGQTGAEVLWDLNVEPAWNMVRGRGIVIGVIDSGLMEDHPDLA
jgi:hypothetical protein